MSSAALPLTAEKPPLPVARFSVEQYHGMIDAGILADGDPFELIEGWIIEKMSQKPAHSAAVSILADALRSLLPKGWCVREQMPVTTADSEPEPDISVVHGSHASYQERHPGTGDVGLVVEVSRTTLGTDLLLKPRVYAKAGFPEYWVVNTAERTIELLAQPGIRSKRPDYLRRRPYFADEKVPFRLDGRRLGFVEVSTVCPARKK